MKNPKGGWWDFTKDGIFKKPKGYWKRFLTKWLLKKEKETSFKDYR